MDRKSIKQLHEKIGLEPSEYKLDPSVKSRLTGPAKKPGIPTAKAPPNLKTSLDRKTTKAPEVKIPLAPTKMPKVKTLDDKNPKEQLRTTTKPVKAAQDVKGASKAKTDTKKPGVSSVSAATKKKAAESAEEVLKMLQKSRIVESDDDTSTDSDTSSEGLEMTSFMKKAGATKPQKTSVPASFSKKGKTNARKPSKKPASSEDSDAEAARELKKILNHEEFQNLDLDDLIRMADGKMIEEDPERVKLNRKFKRPVKLPPMKLTHVNEFSNYNDDDVDDDSDYDENGLIKSLVVPKEVQEKYQNMMKRKVAAVGIHAAPLTTSDEERYGDDPKPMKKGAKNKDRGDAKEAVITTIVQKIEGEGDSSDELMDMLNEVSLPTHKSAKGDIEDKMLSLRDRLHMKKDIMNKTEAAISTLNQKGNKDKKAPMYSSKHQDILSELTPENWSSKLSTLTKDIEKAKARLASGDDKEPFMSAGMRQFHETVEESVDMMNKFDTRRKGDLRTKEFKDMLKHLQSDDVQPKTKTTTLGSKKTVPKKAAKEDGNSTSERPARKAAASKLKI